MYQSMLLHHFILSMYLVTYFNTSFHIVSVSSNALAMHKFIFCLNIMQLIGTASLHFVSVSFHQLLLPNCLLVSVSFNFNCIISNNPSNIFHLIVTASLDII